MDKSEALEAIESLQVIMRSTNRAFVSVKQMLAIGVGLLLVPFLEIFLDQVTLQSFLYEKLGSVYIAFKALLYGLFFYFLGSKFNDRSYPPAHPLIAKAFGLEKTFVYTVLLTAAGLELAGHSDLIYPMIFILMGLLYNLFGKFINKSFIWVSWAYLLMGPLFMYLMRLEYENLWMIFIFAQGLLTIFIAYYTKKYDSHS